MAYEIIVTPYAEVDLKDALAYYNEVSESIHQAFLTTLKTKLKSIQQNPLQFPVAIDKTRKAVIKGFPYNIYFVINLETVFVTAIFNTWRNPQILYNR